MKHILFDFWNFIKNPKDLPYSGNEKNYKWSVFFTLFGFELILLAVYLPATTLLDKYVMLEQSLDLSLSAIGSFFIFVLLVPFVEEVFFRLGLRRKGFLKELISENTWQRWFPFFVYSSTLTFGFIHLTNYANVELLFFLLAPLIVLTQVVGGFIMAYLRVRFNFWMGYLYHATWNFIMIFIIGSVFIFFTENTHIKTDDYELEIKEEQFSGFFESKKIEYQEGANNDILSITSDQYSMNKILEIVYPENKKYIAKPVLVKFKFTSEKGISKDRLLLLLEQEEYIKARKSKNAN
ncbi:MAG TPA: CPBP family intramembrane glutamic endopeptidase [Flavobacterium sp.]|nr:CPBP family intramembrane glutamic endopeptidase [Flavobacterium sp.]